MLDLHRLDNILLRNDRPPGDILIVEFGIYELLDSIMDHYLLEALVLISDELHEVMRPSHCDGIAHIVFHDMLGYFLGEDLLISIMRAEHLDDLDFLGRVFASLVHTLLIYGYYN